MTNGNEKNKFTLKSIGTYIGIFLAICSTIGVIFALDSRWVKKEDLSGTLVTIESLKESIEKLDTRFSNKLKSDRILSLQNRIWRFEEKWPDVTLAPQEVRDSVREMKLEMKQLVEELKKSEWDKNGNSDRSKL